MHQSTIVGTLPIANGGAEAPVTVPRHRAVPGDRKLGVLLVGNFLSGSVGTRGACEELALRLSGLDWLRVLTTSTKAARLPRLADMLATIWLRRHEFEVAQVDVYSGPAFLWAEACCLALRRLGKPYILTLHGGNLPAFSRERAGRVRRLLQSAAVVTTPSEYLRDQMSPYHADLRLLPNALDLSAYQYRLRSKPQPNLIWLRAFHEIYNPDMAPRVLQILAKDFPDLKMIMVGPDKGDGTLARTQKLAAELGVLDRLTFAGRVPKSDTPQWLDKGDIFLNTPNVDNTPVSVLEALACGLCIVSTNVGGIPYMLKDQSDALLVPPGDAPAMAAAVRRILTEPGLAGTLSGAARAKAEQHDWQTILPQWETLLNAVAQRAVVAAPREVPADSAAPAEGKRRVAKKRRCYFIGTPIGDLSIMKQFVALANDLARRGHQVIILAPHRRIELENHHTNPAIYIWPSERPTKWRDAWFFYKLARQFRPDCVVASYAAVNIMTLVGWLARVPQRVTWYHTLSNQIDLDLKTPGWRMKLLRARKRLVYRLATYIVPVSRAAQDDVGQLYNQPESKLRVFLNAVADPLPAGGADAGNGAADTLVCIARFSPSKGQDVLIRALTLLKAKHPQVTLEFLGDGPAGESYKQLARELGVADQCRFLGAVGHDEVLRRMRSATATVLPSRNDNCPLVTIESLAVGTPVIASRVGGIPEVVRDGVDGFLAPPDDPQALAEKLDEVLSNPALLQKLRANARAGFLSRLELRQAVTEQADWLESISRKP